MKRFLVFQHMPWEKPGGHLLRAAKSRKVRLDVIEVWREPIPDIDPYDGVIVLGGAPNVDEEEKYPFLKSEKKAIRYVLEKDRAYLGFCLGHQLLAHVLGANVGPNFCNSIGFVNGQITKEGREHSLFHNLPQSIPFFKWHSQAVLPPLPKVIEVLATSRECQVEMISVQGRPHLVGMQFDNHAASYNDLNCWIESDRGFLDSRKIDPGVLLESIRELEFKIGAHFALLFENYLKILS